MRLPAELRQMVGDEGRRLQGASVIIVSGQIGVPSIPVIFVKKIHI